MTRRISIALVLLSALFVSCAQRTAQRLQEGIGRGHVLYEERRYSEAMEAYSHAETMALKAEDYHSLGIIYECDPVLPGKYVQIVAQNHGTFQKILSVKIKLLERLSGLHIHQPQCRLAVQTCGFIHLSFMKEQSLSV